MEVFLPGDIISTPSSSEKTTVVGYGIDVQDNELICVQPGALRTNENNVWLNVHSKRYIPVEGDKVIGLIVGKAGDYFRVDIGSAELALISFTNFEGATKRNRPNLKTGDIIYAHVFESSSRTEAELTCIDDENRARGMGQLKDGFSFKISLNHARRLLNTNCKILNTIGQFFKFEITVGLNGRIWIRGQNHDEVIGLYNIIEKSEFVTGSAFIDLVSSMYTRTKQSV